MITMLYFKLYLSYSYAEIKNGGKADKFGGKPDKFGGNQKNI